MICEPATSPVDPTTKLLEDARTANTLAHQAREAGDEEGATKHFHTKTALICQAILAGGVILIWHEERHAIFIYSGEGENNGLHVTIFAIESYIRTHVHDRAKRNKLRKRVERVKTSIGRRRKRGK